jgi:ribose-phosphate pyrophosphokinase
MNAQFPAKIFTGSANPTLSKFITKYLNIKLGDVEIETFSDGEIRIEIEETIRGSEIFIIQPTCSPTNNNLMELLIMADAARRSDCSSITAVIPYYGYARQDRRPDYTRTPITSRLVADMIEISGIDRVITIDIHSGQQQGFFHIPVTNISASPEIVGDIWRNHKPADIVVVSPDTGGVDRARYIAKQLDDADLAIIDKRRPKPNVSQVMNIIGNVEGKTCIMIDDMIDTAGTLTKGVSALKTAGAVKVIAYATHGVFSGNAFNNIMESELDEVIVTDTIPLSPKFKNESKIRVLSIAPLLAETIRRMQSGQSISALYA